MTLEPVKTRAPLHREIAEMLSARIVSGELPAKALLPTERELCSTLGVSRTVVREAIKTLESRGLVRIERGRGTIVQEPRSEPVTHSLRLVMQRSKHTFNDLLEVRKILETEVAALAARRRTDEDLAQMDQHLETMRRKPNEPEGYIDGDVGFHTQIARAARNPILLILLEPLTELLRQSREESFAGVKMVKIRLRQHQEIFDSIRNRDPEAARAMMLKHLTDTEEDLERHKRMKARHAGP